MSKTNETTRQILQYLYNRKIFAWRNNSTGLFDPRLGIFRPAAKTGTSDIFAILPGGKFCGIEVKTGSDHLRPEQIGFIANVERMGGIALVVKDFSDFLVRFSALYLTESLSTSTIKS